MIDCEIFACETVAAEGEATEAAPHPLSSPFSLLSQRNGEKYQEQTPKYKIMHHTL